jgi:hypothetical protein
MSWQEELQQLDSELAQGRVTPEDYRLRRDQLLGVAQSQQPPQTPPGGQPAQPADKPASSPFGQPFRWQPPASQQAQPPAESAAESTQVLRPITDEPAADSAERTQVVRNTGGDSAERTQVVPNTGFAATQNLGPQTPAPWQPMPQQPGIGQQPQEYGAAPWSNELPPDFGKASWPLQGPEVFDTGKNGRKTGKIIAIAVAAVLVVGLGTGIYFFTVGSKGNTATTTTAATSATSTTPTTTTPPPPKLPSGPFVQVPGKQVYNVDYPIADAVTNRAPTEQEVNLLKNAGVVSVGAVVTTADPNLHEGIWAFKAGAGADPKAVLTAIDNLYSQAGYKTVTADIPTGVLARTLPATPPDTQTAFRAHYISKGYVIRVEAYSPDAAAAEKAFRDLLKIETQKYAPTP